MKYLIFLGLPLWLLDLHKLVSLVLATSLEKEQLSAQLFASRQELRQSIDQ